MENEENLIIKQLACDIKNLADLNYAILYNKSYTKLMGQSTMKKLERVETQLDTMINIIERKFLLLNNEDLVDLYKFKNRRETIQEMIKRLDK